jgi:hypothetical protein
MRRPVLLTLAVLGGVVCLIGGVGLFASLSDTGKTGPLTAQSGALAGSADIKLTTAHLVDPTMSGQLSIACDNAGYSDDLTTDTNTISASPNFTSDKLFFCIKNVGSQPVSVTFDAFEMVDVELACTGDEALFDSDCGLPGGVPGIGELSGVLSVIVEWYPQCDPNPIHEQSTRGLKSLASTPLALHGLSASGGPPECYSLTLSYPEAGPTSTNTPAMIQAAQSDQVTWRFRFNAST